MLAINEREDANTKPSLQLICFSKMIKRLIVILTETKEEKEEGQAWRKTIVIVVLELIEISVGIWIFKSLE